LSEPPAAKPSAALPHDLGPAPFFKPRYDRPDILRDPEAYRDWLNAYALNQVAPPIIGGEGASARAERKWYVVLTQPRAEYEVCRQLRGARDIMACAPLRRFWQTRLKPNGHRKRVKMTEALLSRYVFVELPIRPGDNTPFDLVLNSIRHTCEFLGADHPMPIAGREVRLLVKREQAGEFDETMTRKKQKNDFCRGPFAWIVPGAAVQIEDGPMAETTGLVQYVDRARGRAKIDIAIGLVDLDFVQFSALIA